MEAKPWQIAVVIIGLLGACVLFAWNVFGGREVRTPDEIMLMDVITGDRFVADVSGRRGVILPEKNPDTQQYTLLPIQKDEDGVWHVRRLDQIGPIPPEQMKAIENHESGIAKPSDAKPRPLRN